MARISGVDLPREKRLIFALTYIFGIGNAKARQIAAAAQVDPMKKVKDLTDNDVAHIRETIERTHRVEGDLRSEIQRNIKRLIDVQSYRGIRHRKGLPTRGQRTHTNARTRKGPRKAVGMAKK